MKFFDATGDTRRGGNIVESVVRMAKWLGMATIAEGVEDRDQADYLKSIGCNYIQGYLYFKPMPIPEFEQLAARFDKEGSLLALKTVENLDNNAFWDPKSMDTLIFNSYVGGACIFEYHNGDIELLRANDQYVQMIGAAGLRIEDAMRLDWAEHLEESDRDAIKNAMDLSLETGESVTGEYVFLDLPGCPKETYLRATMRVIASSGDHMLVYCTNENTTPQRQAEKKEHETAEHLSAIMRNITGGVTASVLRDGAMRLIFANEQFYEQRGYTRAQYEREVGDPQETVYPEDRARIRELSLTASQTCLPYSAVYRVVRRNGEVRWLQKNVSITSFASEEEPVHLSVSNDITEQKEAQQTLMETDDQLRFLNTIAHELLAQPDSDIGLQSVLEKLLSYFRGERAYIFELDPGEDTVSNTYEVCKEGVTPQKDSLQRLPVEMCQFWIRSFDDKSYIDVPDVDTLDDSRAEEKEVLRAQGIRSLIAVPLERDGKLIGFIGVDDPSRQHARVDRLMALGDYIAVMLTHRDLDRKILNDNETLLSLMNDTPGGFVRMRVRPDGAIVPIYFNQGFQTLVGMNNDELMALYGEDAMAGVHPDDLAVVYAAVAGMRKSGEAHSSAYRLRHGAGGYVRVMFFGRMKKSASGEEFLNIYYTDAARDDIAVLVGAENQADQRVKLLTDSIPGGLATYLCTPDKISVQYFNDGFCRLFGFDRAGFFQQSSVDPRVVVFEQDLPLLMRQVRALIERGDPIDCVYRVHTKDGGYKWIEHKAVAAGKTDGGVLVNAVLLDVTRQHEATERLRISEEEHRLAVAQSGNIICRYSVADKTMHMSRETADTLSLPEQIIDVPYGPVRLGMISRENEQAYIDFFESIDRGEKTGTMVFSHLMTGVWRWMEAHFSTIFADDGKPVSAVITFYDVTERLWKEAVYNKWQQSMQEKDPGSYTLFRSNLSKSASFDTMEGKLLWADFGADTDSFNGRTREYADQCVFESDREEYVALLNSDTLLANYYRGKRNYVMEYREKLQSGGVRWLRLTVDLVEYPNSTEVEAYLMYENIDDSKRAELLTIERAEMDPLTCVLNRATFAARADRILRDSRPDERHAFLMIDIDSFKMVNDVFGHAAGDQALVDTAAAIRAALRREDLVGRLGGDEFVAFLRDIPNDAVAATKARSICANMRKALSLEVQISGSIGIVVSPRDGADFQTLYQKADAALYHVKGSGKDNFAFYGEDMRDEHLKPEGEPAGDARAPHVEKKRRMLIVDDSVIDHAMLANIFDDEFIIERAKDGSNALIRLRHYGTAISVVLLDLFMPGMNGFEVLEKMQAAAELQAIPVIVVSGDDNRETSLRAIRAGATDFVTKPVDAELLRIRVQSAISKAENERLRAQNSFLEMQRDELAKFRTVLAHTGTALLEYDWVKGAFSYDASMSAHIDGIWDKRTLWRILLSDMVADVSTVRRMQEFVHSVADDRKTQSGSIIVPLRTPSRETRQFRMNVYKESDAFQLTNRLVITFNDVEDGGQATDTETI